MIFTCRSTKITIVGIVLLLFASCSSIYQNHGYVPPDDSLQEVEVGISNREAVAEAIGTPAIQNSRYGETWIYAASRFKIRGYLEADEVDRQVVAVSFDEAGVLSNVERFTLEDGQVIVLSRRVTELNLGRLSVVEQVLRGLGRIDPTSILDRDE